MPSAKQLFHAIVIVGAALTAGCGDDESKPSTDAGMADASRVIDAALPIDSGADARVDAMVIII